MISRPTALERPKEKVIGIPMIRNRRKMIPRTARAQHGFSSFLCVRLL